MLISEMSGEECRDLLARLGFGRLASAHQNQPYIVPIYFAYEPDRLYGFTTLGRKVEWMRSNPLVCVEVDEVLSHFRWSSVVVLGRYEELPETSEYREVRLQAELRLEKRALWWQTAYAANQVRSGPHTANAVFYCIHIDEITGRRATADPVESANRTFARRTPLTGEMTKRGPPSARYYLAFPCASGIAINPHTPSYPHSDQRSQSDFLRGRKALRSSLTSRLSDLLLTMPWKRRQRNGPMASALKVPPADLTALADTTVEKNPHQPKCYRCSYCNFAAKFPVRNRIGGRLRTAIAISPNPISRPIKTTLPMTRLFMAHQIPQFSDSRIRSLSRDRRHSIRDSQDPVSDHSGVTRKTSTQRRRIIASPIENTKSAHPVRRGW